MAQEIHWQKKRKTSWVKSLLRNVLFPYVIICLVVMFMQRDLLYHPTKELRLPQDYNLNMMEYVSLNSVDDVRITTWVGAPKQDMPVVVFFSGNAGNLGTRAQEFSRFLHAGFGLMAVSYRGYGTSEGSPSEAGLYNDARAAIEYVQAKMPEHEIILYGESLGTGVASKMATEYKVAGLVLEAPYSTMADAAQHVYPWLPASLLLWDRYDNIHHVKQIDCPLLIFHGIEDSVIPHAQGVAVFDAAIGQKKMLRLPNVGHNNIDPTMVSQEMLQYFVQ